MENTISKDFFKGEERDYLLLTIASLLTFGLVMIYSASIHKASLPWKFGDPQYYLKRQMMWLALSSLSFILGYHLDYRYLRRHTSKLLIFLWILLALVLHPAIGSGASHGAIRWIRFGPIGFQPSEMAKPILVLFFASYIAQNHSKMKDFRTGFLPAMTVLAITCSLIIVEPDFGTTAFVAFVSLLLLILGGIRLKHLAPFFVGSAFVVLGYALTRFNHVKERLGVWWSPESALQGAGYQIQQSLIALGSGGWMGVGLGKSQQKLLFLPEEHTDFILAVIGEELGFCGITLLLTLFSFFVFLGYRISQQAPDLYSSILALGITLLIAIQAIFNMGVVTATFPNKGISLPFISFGGSSLFFLLFEIGLLANIARSLQSPLQASLSTPSAPAVSLS
jgi:cell division protein FtsW